MNKLNYVLCLFVVASISYRINLEIGSTGLLEVIGLSQTAASNNALAVNSLQADLPEMSLTTHDSLVAPTDSNTQHPTDEGLSAVSVPDIAVPALLMDATPDMRVEITREGRSIHRNQARTHRKLPPSYPIYDPPPTPSPTKH